MKTTLELPDTLLRHAKALAALRGQSLKAFVTEAIRSEIKAAEPGSDAPWRALFGGLKHLSDERPQIEAAIAEAFETVEPEPGA